MDQTLTLAPRHPAQDARALGLGGEELASQWYTSRGYEILARNWTWRGGELDIVACREGTIVFCEVKARSSRAFGEPPEAVGPLKQARLRRSAAAWFAQQACRASDGLVTTTGRRRGGPVRFDVACVFGWRVEVLEGAF